MHKIFFSQNFAEVMFRKGSLKAQRLLVATELTSPDKVEVLSRQLWLRIWGRVSSCSFWRMGEKEKSLEVFAVQDEDITEDGSLREAGKKAGLSEEEIDKLLEMIQTEEVKEKLKQRTQETLDLGVEWSTVLK